MYNRRDYKTALIVVAAVLAVYGVYHLLGIGCPIKYVTGISCAGCGMTRAVISLFRLRFQEAFFYHPLVLLLFPMAFLFLIREKLHKGVKTFLLWLFAGVFMLTYIYRMFDTTQDVVVFHPENGAFIRAVNGIRELFV